MVDDTTIDDDEIIWRRVPPWHFAKEQVSPPARPTSAAFEDHPDGSPMSAVLSSLVEADGRDASSVLQGHESYGLVSFAAELARSKGLGLIRKPIDGEPAHIEVFGKKTKSVKRALAKGCKWVVPPATQTS